MEKIFKCLSYENRKIIEEMLNQGENVTAIVDMIGCHRVIIYNELIKRGGVPYCADVAQVNVQSEIRNEKLKKVNYLLEELKKSNNRVCF